MIWQTASLVPIPYMASSTVVSGDHVMPEIAQTLEGYDFNVIVDGVKLFKPIILDGPVTEVLPDTVGDGDGPFQFPLEFQETVWGSELAVKGYLYGSAGSALHPDNIRGILIRLKQVGIGEYDKSLLDYRFAEGPRYAWLTGELFVEHGLEDSLTVGRDGFDAGHPHYLALRNWVHKELRHRVFPTLYRGIRSRRTKRELLQHEHRESKFLESMSDFARMPISIREISRKNSPPVEINLHEGIVLINSAAPWPRGRRQREMVQKLSVVFQLVHCVDSDRRDVEEFVDLAREIISQR